MDNTNSRSVKPFEPGSFLRKIKKGPNTGKYEVRGMEGARNSLKRFADIPFYVVKDDKDCRDRSGFSLNNEGLVFTTKEEADCWQNKFGGVVAEIILTKDQIIK